MWSIIYRVLVPGILVSILFGLFLLREIFHSKKKTASKNHRRLVLLYSCVIVLSLILSAYSSLDLVFRDFKVQEGVYVKDYRGKEVYIKEFLFLFDDEDDTVSCYSFSGSDNAKSLKQGKRYIVTYAKRTHMLLSVDEV